MSVAYSWEKQIRQRAYFAKEAVTTGDFTTLDVIRAQEYVVGIDPIATLRGSVTAFRDAQVEGKLKDINQQCVATCEKDYNRFSEKVEKLKDDPSPTQANWQEAIWANAEQLKQESNEAIDNAANAAIAVIGQLPEASRPAAANGFNAAFNIVIGFFKNIGEAIKRVAQAVVDFIKGIWNKLVSAYETVKGWAQTAWNAIQALFSRAIYSPDPDSPKLGPNGQRKGSQKELETIRHELIKLLDRVDGLAISC
ncbi:uncharacterized protein KD926_004701 [Aspergillus affinis]|uniref:uncharacterized protein n=1 Tax=Aspergillus affinis TaxID=1070780 RepID=UPI0022FDF0B1|nr:uncharacterized protein KD926_004701 [Aspergillus affinis]KAI9035027.1 hypothetical protein KD926_004701 [Aspergillus affinis]